MDTARYLPCTRRASDVSVWFFPPQNGPKILNLRKITFLSRNKAQAMYKNFSVPAETGNKSWILQTESRGSKSIIHIVIFQPDQL